MAISSINSLSTLNSTQKAINSSIRKIATGSNYPDASYGASAYAITQRTQYNLVGVSQSIQNTQNSNAKLQTASGAVNSTVSALSSLRSTLLEAANGTNSGTDLSALQNTVNQTIVTIDDNASVTYNGQRLLDGTQTVSVAGNDGYTDLQLGNLSAQGLGLTDNQGNSTINLTDKSSISSALSTVDSALNSALDQATSIGAAQQGLSYQAANYTTQSEELQYSLANSDDTDLASEVTKLKSAQTQQQFALYATKMQNVNRASVLSLLQQ